METLLEEYKRRLKIINKMIEELRFKDDANPVYIRLIVKADCYQTFIAELNHAMSK